MSFLAVFLGIFESSLPHQDTDRCQRAVRMLSAGFEESEVRSTGDPYGQQSMQTVWEMMMSIDINSMVNHRLQIEDDNQ